MNLFSGPSMPVPTPQLVVYLQWSLLPGATRNLGTLEMILLAIGIIYTNHLQTPEPWSLAFGEPLGGGTLLMGEKKGIGLGYHVSLSRSSGRETNRLFWDFDEMFSQAREPELIDEDGRLEDISTIPGEW